MTMVVTLKLFTEQEILISLVGTSLSHPRDIIQTLSTDTYVLPLQEPYQEEKKHIYSLTPEYLPDHPNQQIFTRDLEIYQPNLALHLTVQSLANIAKYLCPSLAWR